MEICKYIMDNEKINIEYDKKNHIFVSWQNVGAFHQIWNNESCRTFDNGPSIR